MDDLLDEFEEEEFEEEENPPAMENPNVMAKKPAAIKPAISYAALVPKGWRQKKTGNCHYVFYDKHNTPHIHISDVCFARFQSQSGIIMGKLLINQHEKVSTYGNNEDYIEREDFRALLKEYILWIVCQSPFRWAFKNGDTDFFKHGLNWNCDVPHKYVFAACNAIREGWEFPWRVEYWHKLIDSGVSHELSYYVVSMLGRDNTIVGGQGHAVMQTSPSGKAFDWFRKLCPASIKVIGQPMSKSAPSTYGVSALFTSSDGKAAYKSPFASLKTVLEKYSKGVVMGEWGEKKHSIDLSDIKLIEALKEIDNA